MIKVLYFASLRDRLKQDQEQLELPDGVTDINGLTSYLARREGAWAEIFDSDITVLSAVNQDMVKPESPINDGDEVGFFPPVTGG